jgi:TonB-linked SusC/RagA family outer membrane protein
MRKIILFSLLLVFSVISFAQSRIITGKVVDSLGSPIQSVSIYVDSRNFKKSTITDKNGEFSVKTEALGKLNFTFTAIGFKKVKVVSETDKPINVTLYKEVTNMDEVVINVGYGTIKKKEVSSSVSSISAKDLKDVPVNSAAEALNGRLAGVTATTSEGSPDADIKVKVRGGMSITNDNSPLYIIDGVQVENGLNTLSPQDIQSIDVLKDAAATAIYGARGANGVIVISTKSGKVGKLKLSYNGFVGIKQLTNTLDVLDPYDFVLYQSERSRGSASDSSNFLSNFGSTWDTLQNYKNASPISWQKQLMGNTGIQNTHSISGMGGTKKITYSFGYTYNGEKAIVLNSRYVRNLANLKFDYKLNKKIKLGGIVRYTNQNVYGSGVSDTKGSAYNRLRSAVKYRPYLSAGQDIDEQDPLAEQQVGNGLSLINPILNNTSEYRKKTTNNLNLTGTFSYTIKKNLTFKSTVGYEEKNYVDRQFSDSITSYSVIQGSRKPIASLDTQRTKTITNSNVLTYSLKDVKNKHDFDFLLGEETYDLRTQNNSSLFGLFPNYISPEYAFNHTDTATAFAGYPKPTLKSRYTSLSFFSRLNYAYKKKIIASINVRADGASKFAPDQRWGVFPAASLAWRLKEEKFLSKVDFINDLKIRGGFGLVGNNRIGNYLYLNTFFNDNQYYYGVNNQPIYAYYPSALPNRNLKWESTINRNLGIDFTFYKNRFDLSVDVYNNSSKDLLLFVPIASTYGYNSQYQNIGKTSNKGLEIQLSAVVMKKKNGLNWNISYNMSFNRNEVEKLGVNQTSFFPSASWGVSGQPTDYIVRIGDPVGSMYGLVTDGFYTVNDFNYNAITGAYTLKDGVVNNSSIIGVIQPGSIKFKDINGDSLVDLNNDRTIIGNPTPKFTGGITQTFTYKQWDMSLFLNFSYGNDVYNANKIEFTNGYTANSNLLGIMKDRWRTITADGQTAQWVSGTTVYGIAPDQLQALNQNAKIWAPLRGSGAFYPHSWAIEDGSFLRVNNITVGYSLPVKALIKYKMSKLRFYATVNNLYVFTNYSGFDPEVSVKSSQLTPNLDYSAYPKSRSFIFGINATF